MKKVVKCCREIDRDFKQNEIDRAHYINKSFINEKKNKNVTSIIIKFSSWESRTDLYKSRQRNHLG